MSLPRLVLVPGLLNDADLWREQCAALAPVASVVVADITRADTLRDMALAVLEAGGARFALAGFSLGGIAALEVMRLAPERVTRLGLLGTTMLPDDPGRAAERDRLIALARSPGAFHGFGDSMLRGYLAPDHAGDPRMAGRVRAMTSRLGTEVFIRQSLIPRPDNRPLLRGIDCPALVLCGAEDRITPPAISRGMAADLPRSRLVIVPGCGHLVPIEAPETVSAELRRLLETGSSEEGSR